MLCHRTYLRLFILKQFEINTLAPKEQYRKKRKDAKRLQTQLLTQIGEHHTSRMPNHALQVQQDKWLPCGA
jgi:hypothetical protein